MQLDVSAQAFIEIAVELLLLAKLQALIRRCCRLQEKW
jgi:hypothetical protein